MEHVIEIENSRASNFLKLNRDKVRWKSLDKEYKLSLVTAWPFKEPPDEQPKTIVVPAGKSSGAFTPTKEGQIEYTVAPPRDAGSATPRSNPEVIVDP